MGPIGKSLPWQATTTGVGNDRIRKASSAPARTIRYCCSALPLLNTLRSKPPEKCLPRADKIGTVLSRSAASNAACSVFSIESDMTLALPSSITRCP
jgi:hypothetical protein